MELKELLSKNLKKFRKEKELTQEELGKKADVPQSLISDIENSKSIPRMDTVQKLANALELDINVLLSEAGK